MTLFTVCCQGTDGKGTIHIACVRAADLADSRITPVPGIVGVNAYIKPER
jgi:hypothetical protein